MFDFESVCRCCLQTSDPNDLFEFCSEISVDDQNNYEKIQIIYNCLILVSKKTSLYQEKQEPISKICALCLQEMKNAFVFQQKSIMSNKIFIQELEIFKEVQLANDDQDIANDYISNEYIIMENEDVVKSELIKEENYLEYIEEEFLDYEQVPELTTDDEELDEETNDKSKNVHLISPKFRKKSTTEIEMEPEMIFKCSLCSKTFDRKNYYRRHWRRVHNDQEIEAATEELIKLKRSDEIKDLQMYQCQYCAKIEVIKSKYLEHLLSHEGEDLFKCRHCDLKFATKDILKDHIMEHGEQKRFICDICGSTTKNKYALTLHYRKHTGEKPFICPVDGCNKGFSMQSNMLKHTETHSVNRSFECDVCGQFCKTQRSLNFHIICFHKTESKIKCPDCNKAFVNKSYLKMHQQYHTGDKKFTCTICESKYYKSSHLKRHIQNVHFKLRLLKCDFCSSDFVRKETYRTHILNQHKTLRQEEIDAVLEKIRNFRPPQLDVEQFTLEKQKYSMLKIQPLDETEQILGDMD